MTQAPDPSGPVLDRELEPAVDAQITAEDRLFGSGAVGTAIALALAVTSILFLFREPFFEGFGTIKWDALHVHFNNLAFSSELLHQGKVPQWTPRIFGGFPQIADPQVAIWYPVNLLLALLAFSPSSILVQLAIHYAVATVGAFRLAFHFSKHLVISLSLSLVWAFGGFMVGHASHVGMQNTAAWLPLIFWLLIRTLETASVKRALACGVALGVAILAGHFQTALYSSTFLLIWALVTIARRYRIDPDEDTRLPLAKTQSGLVVLVFAVGLAIAAVQLIPTAELASQSGRASITLAEAQASSLQPSSLFGMVDYNYRHTASGVFRGQGDPTQNYLFLGPAFLLLAFSGLFLNLKSRVRRAELFSFTCIGIVALFYSFGSNSFVSELFYRTVPLFDKVRAPTNMMVIVNLCLFCLAALAAERIREISAVQRVPLAEIIAAAVAIPVILAASQTDLLYSRSQVLGADIIGYNPTAVSAVVADYLPLPPEQRYRVFAVRGLFLNESQYRGIETFDGYNPLQLQRHADYVQAMFGRPQLADAAGIKYLPCTYLTPRPSPKPYAKFSGLCTNDSFMSKASLIPTSVAASSPQDALLKTGQVDLHQVVILESAGITSAATSAVPGSIRYEVYEPGNVAFRVSQQSGSYLLFNETYYPGWSATVDGQKTTIYRADYLFQAVAVPAGEHLVTFKFQARYFLVGFLISLGTIFSIAAYSASPLFPQIGVFMRKLSAEMTSPLDD